ncbi:endonuclease III [Flavihumibacter cheonanensis]|uniref:endonuclease III n=1 Tax=Flavihumibacter cheonanensis TaxID=1442385 RepID=UPI001EF84118|nr:endonuclease III [Flavihumibacter cheonanensis]MCG7754702.1 endonuclease III [Flavihumibacter cheonanensis]
MTIKERYSKVIAFFQQQAPNAETELLYDNPFQLLVAVVLSAQCTDKRVNLTTPALFERFPDAAALSNASVEEIFTLIRSISYPNNKAKHLVGLGKMLMEQFDGEVPMTVEELIKLPGVGRKTANVITSVVDAQPNMAVDTHVFRVSARLGLTKNARTPLAAEKQLIRHLPKELVHIAHHWLILHGRYVCTARSPQCSGCGLRDICVFYKRVQAKQPTKTTHGK